MPKKYQIFIDSVIYQPNDKAVFPVSSLSKNEIDELAVFLNGFLPEIVEVAEMKVPRCQLADEYQKVMDKWITWNGSLYNEMSAFIERCRNDSNLANPRFWECMLQLQKILEEGENI